MKKIISILLVAVMTMAVFMPLSAANGTYDDKVAIADESYEGGEQPQDASATGQVTYATSGDNNDGGGTDTEPLEILAKWETTECYGYDDDTSKPGLQVDPPMTHDGEVNVCAYAVIRDASNVLSTSNVKFDVSWPMNNILGLQEYDGHHNDAEEGLKYRNLHPDYADYDEYLNAYNDLHSIPENDPFICYYGPAEDYDDGDAHDYIEWQWGENNIKVVKVCFDLYYCDPAGWYDVTTKVYGSVNTDTQTNYFEYVMGVGVEIDFDTVDFGTRTEIEQWFKEDGNWNFNPAEDPSYPTIRNIGNWDAELGIHFSAGDFDPEFVRYDVRIGDENPDSDRHNKSYAEEDGASDGMHADNNLPSDEGMLADTDYCPLVIDNSAEPSYNTRENRLLKCHTAKMDFYLWPGQWPEGPGDYSFGITIFVNEPGYYPAGGSPCGQTA